MAKTMNRELVHVINVGDRITNPELDLALTFYRDLSDKLDIMGPEFKHAWREVYSTLGRLEGFRRARDNKA